jgi:hypothetical protein
MMDFLESGLIRPIAPMRVFPGNKVEDAFRHMQNSSRLGKAVVTIPENLQKLPMSKSIPEVKFTDDASYLLIGGLGGLAVLSQLGWLNEERDISSSSHGPLGDPRKDKAFIHELKVQGCCAQAIAGSVADVETVKHVVNIAANRLRECSNCPWHCQTLRS